MPPMLTRKDVSRISQAMIVQARTGQPSLRITNRCVALISPFPVKPSNRNNDFIPKPMRQEDVERVLKLTGFMPIIETKFVRRGRG